MQSRSKVPTITTRVGWLLSVYNTSFKADQPIDQFNKKWIHAPGSFESVWLAQDYAERVYGKGIKTVITGARQNNTVLHVPERDLSPKTIKTLVKKVDAQKKTA